MKDRKQPFRRTRLALLFALPAAIAGCSCGSQVVTSEISKPDAGRDSAAGGRNTGGAPNGGGGGVTGAVSGASGQGGLAESGGGSGEATGGGTGFGGTTADAACPPPPVPSAPWDWPTDPSLFDGGVFGCYPGIVQAPDNWRPNGRVPNCRGNDLCTYEPRDLPCGPCAQEGRVCSMGVWAPCNCGHGGFLDNYFDGWFCKCLNGQWDCRDTDISGASCEVCWVPNPPDAGSSD